MSAGGFYVRNSFLWQFLQADRDLVRLVSFIFLVLSHLQQSFPSGSRDWGFVLKDIFLLFAALQTYITNLRRENVVRATASPTAVLIM